MVYRIQAHLRFASAAARTAGRATIASAASGRDVTVTDDRDVARFGEFHVLWDATSGSTGDAGIVYALIQAMSSPLPASLVRHHTCFHGDNTNACLVTAQKVW